MCFFVVLERSLVGLGFAGRTPRKGPKMRFKRLLVFKYLELGRVVDRRLAVANGTKRNRVGVKEPRKR